MPADDVLSVVLPEAARPPTSQGAEGAVSLPTETSQRWLSARDSALDTFLPLRIVLHSAPHGLSGNRRQRRVTGFTRRYNSARAVTGGGCKLNPRNHPLSSDRLPPDW